MKDGRKDVTVLIGRARIPPRKNLSLFIKIP